MIVAFEGVDGAGKNTLVSAVEQELLAREIPAASVAFPRYEHSASAQLAAEALHGKMGDLIDSVHGMATLFALDRHDVADDLSGLDADGFVILLDRYTASNAAYSAARMESGADHPIVDWIARLEFGTLGVPVPDLHILVDVDADIAAGRAAQRETQDSSRTRDEYERNTLLQQRTVAAYRELAKKQWRSPWIIADSADDDVEARAIQIADAIVELIEVSG